MLAFIPLLASSPVCPQVALFAAGEGQGRCAAQGAETNRQSEAALKVMGWATNLWP